MKKIIFFICFSFVFLICGLSFLIIPTSLSFAEGETDIEVLDISAVVQSSKTSIYQSSFKIGEGEYVSKTAKLLKEDGTEFIVSIVNSGTPDEGEEPTDPEEPTPPETEEDDTTAGVSETEEVVIYSVNAEDLPANLQRIEFSDNSFMITKNPSLDETFVSLKYQIVFTFEDSTTLTKTANINVAFHNLKVELVKQNEEEIFEVDCDLNNPVEADYFKQYIDTSETNVPLDEITTQLLGNMDFYTITSGAVKFTYENPSYEIDGKTIAVKIEKWLTINVTYPDDWQGVDLEIFDGENYVETLDLGEVEYENNWQYSGSFRTNVKELNITYTNATNFLVIIEESETFGIYNFTVRPKGIIEGSQTINFRGTFDVEQSEYVSLKINFKISSTPQLLLKSKNIVLDKGITFGDIKNEIESNLVTVTDVLGELRENEDVVITYLEALNAYQDEDIVACGDYKVRYSYTSQTLTYRVCTTTEEVNVSVVNTKPVFTENGIVVRVDGEDVENNGQIYVNKNIDVQVSAQDINGDTMVFVIDTTMEVEVVASNPATLVVKNSNTRYTISSTSAGNISTINFQIRSQEKYFGDFGFTVSVYDDGTFVDAGDSFDFSVRYYETGIPVLVINKEGMVQDGFDSVYVLNIMQEFVARNLFDYIDRAEDEFDTTVNKSSVVIEVTKDGTPQTLNGTTFTFKEVGVYYVNYTVTDVSGNTTSDRFRVVVNETPNDTPTVSPYILDLNVARDKDFAYSEVISINIDEYFTINDDDAKCKNCGEMVLTGDKNCPNCGQDDAMHDILTYYNEIGAFSAADTSSAKILCTNSESFSWDTNCKILTFKQDPNAYYLGTIYIALRVDDGTGLVTGISDPVFIKITFVDNIDPIVTQTQAQTTFVIGRDDSSNFDKTAYFVAVNDLDKTTITPVVNILDEDGNQVLNIDFTVAGTYTLNYYFRYERGGQEKVITKSVAIKVVTGGIPNIVLKQEKLQIVVGDTFDISSIFSQIEDAEDGSFDYETLKDKIIIEGLPEDFETPGEYKITIRYADNDNNQTEKEFTLKIVQPSKAWIYVLIGFGSAIVVAGITILIIFLSRRRYTRI